MKRFFKILVGIAAQVPLLLVLAVAFVGGYAFHRAVGPSGAGSGAPAGEVASGGAPATETIWTWWRSRSRLSRARG